MVDYRALFFLYCSIGFHANAIQFTNKGKSLNIVWDGCDKRLQNLSPGSVVRATQGKNCISKWLKPISSHMPILKDHVLQPSDFEAIGLRSNAMCIVFIKLEDYIVFNISQGNRPISFPEGIQSYITKNIVVYLKYGRRDEYCYNCYQHEQWWFLKYCNIYLISVSSSTMTNQGVLGELWFKNLSKMAKVFPQWPKGRGVTENMI